MTEYYIPTAPAQAELVEKRSRFIGQVKPVETEEEARAFVEQVKKKHYDARHNCWCYRLQDGGVERYSDDGEPQGTAGQPMLNVFQREEITNVVCVVTRYFGGVLLGAGGLVRAYTQSAKDALDAAGVSVVRRWVEAAVPCPYSFLDRVKLEVEAHGGVLGEIEYAADVTVHALLPEEQAEAFSARMTELTAGGTAVQILGEAFKAVPVSR
ncbi:YigZ family protein [uncultured Pseudoflavonifractor sp.]|uniref:YigZ family protein n=1 Tax=uncultured Pseudoflavonifractor sp. TaxID=1221379 RepID=UPI0025E0ECA3|nr:YigZ family protein [uncultured Pseudoflavonifractor sp.]